ncbi:MAG: hypothetical protein HUU20_07415 [Pirellulales bacterium]|nr:hypothetical protein [Pirellulales bacterium]
MKRGVRDEEFPDMPLGGWAGTISLVDRNRTCTVRWSQETLESLHPVYRKRCAIHGLIFEEYRFGEEDLEPDPGGPPDIEQPTQITPRRLSAAEQDDRVRMVFGLTSDDFLPRVSEESLEIYYDYLEERLTFPFDARDEAREGSFRSRMRAVTVTGLGSDTDLDQEEGVLCKVRTTEGEAVLPLADLRVLRSAGHNHKLADDYTAWFLGELGDDSDEDGLYDEDFDDEDVEEDEGDDEEAEEDEVIHYSRRPKWAYVVWIPMQILLFGACFGAMVGSAVAVMPWAKWGACIGGVSWGLFVGVIQARSDNRLLFIIAPRFRNSVGGLVGLTTGAIQGTFFGIAVVAWIGALAGLGAAVLFQRSFSGRWREPSSGIFPGSLILGPAVGVVAQASYLDSNQAIVGFWSGALAGLGGGLVCVVIMLLVFLVACTTTQDGPFQASSRTRS